MATTPQTNATLQQIAEVLKQHDNFVICGHVSPDGDCLGSQLCLGHALKALGKNCVCVLVKDDPIGISLAFMPGLQNMVPVSSYDGPCDVFVGVDVPLRSRIGAASALLDRAQVSITIDHHAADERMCDYAYVDPQSASASILVWRVAKLLMDKPPLESATCAYTGLLTDTGGFRFQNSDKDAFSAASELVAYGVNPAQVATQVFQNRTEASLKLESLALERMRVLADGQAVLSWVSKEDMDSVGAIKADVEPLIDSLRALSGVRVACMLREQDGKVRGSLRSKDKTDVSVLARQLNGGGHKAAAGLSVDAPLEEAVELLQEKLTSLVTA